MSGEKPRENPTVEEMCAAIQASGYLLEGRIAHVLMERGFYAEANSFRPDPLESTKTIEVDVHGRYFESVNEENADIAIASIIVECKNNSQPFAFFVRRQRLPELNDARIQYGGFPAFSRDQETKVAVPLHTLLEMKSWHHYCGATEIATQFCSFNRAQPKSEWRTEAILSEFL